MFFRFAVTSTMYNLDGKFLKILVNQKSFKEISVLTVITNISIFSKSNITKLNLLLN